MGRRDLQGFSQSPRDSIWPLETRGPRPSVGGLQSKGAWEGVRKTLKGSVWDPGERAPLTLDACLPTAHVPWAPPPANASPLSFLAYWQQL